MLETVDITFPSGREYTLLAKVEMKMVSMEVETAAERYQRVGYDALLAIARHIVTIPDGQWDMGSWNKTTDCGTVGCAVGSSCHLDAVAATGLYLAREFEPSFGGTVRHLFPTFGKSQGFTAVNIALGISYDDAVLLFDPWSYSGGRPSQMVVANRILNYLVDNPRG